MNVRELIDLLEGTDPEAEVRIAHQPSWPLQCGIGRVVETAGEHDVDANGECQTCGEGFETTEDIEAHLMDTDGTGTPTVYVAESELPYDVNPYVPGDVAAELGWRA